MRWNWDRNKRHLCTLTWNDISYQIDSQFLHLLRFLLSSNPTASTAYRHVEQEFQTRLLCLHLIWNRTTLILYEPVMLLLPCLHASFAFLRALVISILVGVQSTSLLLLIMSSMTTWIHEEEPILSSQTELTNVELSGYSTMLPWTRSTMLPWTQPAMLFVASTSQPQESKSVSKATFGVTCFPFQKFLPSYHVLKSREQNDLLSSKVLNQNK